MNTVEAKLNLALSSLEVSQRNLSAVEERIKRHRANRPTAEPYSALQMKKWEADLCSLEEQQIHIGTLLTAARQAVEAAERDVQLHKDAVAKLGPLRAEGTRIMALHGLKYDYEHNCWQGKLVQKAREFKAEFESAQKNIAAFNDAVSAHRRNRPTGLYSEAQMKRWEKELHRLENQAAHYVAEKTRFYDAFKVAQGKIQEVTVVLDRIKFQINTLELLAEGDLPQDHELSTNFQAVRVVA